MKEFFIIKNPNRLTLERHGYYDDYGQDIYHREDGPAIVRISDGCKIWKSEYWYHGKHIYDINSEEEFSQEEFEAWLKYKDF